MNNKKTVIRFFTIVDYEEEEIWLHNQHMNGWRLVKMIPPCSLFSKSVRQRKQHPGWIIKTIRKPVTISKFLEITVGNLLVVVLDGCIFVNRQQRWIPSVMAKYFPIMNQE